MPQDPARILQLDLFLRDAQAYRDALARYEAIRPILKRERTLAQHRRVTGLSYWRLWRGLRRFRRAGILGQYRLAPAALQRHHHVEQQASLPTPLPTQQLTLPLGPHTLGRIAS
jgi:hypothetical protein